MKVDTESASDACNLNSDVIILQPFVDNADGGKAVVEDMIS